MSETTRTAPSSNLSTRFAAGILMAAVALAAVYFGGWWFRALVTVGAIVMWNEWLAMHHAPRPWLWIGGVLLALALLGTFVFVFSDAVPPTDENSVVGIELDDLQVTLLLAGAIVVVGAAMAALARRVAVGWGFVYIAVPALALLILSWIGFELVFWVMAVTWATDVLAYFAGRLIGGPKLAPSISPNKTWAGLVGGIVGAGLAGWGVSVLFDLGSPWLWLGAPMAILAQAGDLYESSVKRRAGVKDSGTILPGHGGVLDRVDGLLPVAVATLAVLLAGLSIG